MKAQPKQQKFSIIRTHSAGVWFGKIKSLKGGEAIITEARMLWQWYGAASIVQLAQEGTKRQGDCKFTMTITDEEGVYLPQVISVLPCTDEATENIKAVRVWKI